MATTNILQQVRSYQKSNLAILQNQNAFISTANTEFENFQKIGTNLGSVVGFDKPPRFTTTDSLVASFQPTTQRLQTLTVDQQISVSYEFTAEERIFNVEKEVDSYMKRFGKGAMAQLGSAVEANVALNANSSVAPKNGARNHLSGPFRSYGNGVSPINSFGQLAQIQANIKDFGSPSGNDIKMYLPVTQIPSIINSGLNQFSLKRNDTMSMSWEVGEFGTPPIKVYSSNQLPTQIAGTVGNQKRILTVVSTNDATGQNITQITFSDTTANDANSIFYGDIFTTVDGASAGNLRFLNYTGPQVSQQPVQFRATADAGTTSNTVVVNIFPGLQVGQPLDDRIGINRNIVAGMQFTVLPSHVCGMVVVGNGLFLAMPRLPDEYPYPSSNEADPATGVSMRMTYGALAFQNMQGMSHSCIWGSTAVPEYTVRIAFPLS